ncbi:PepSY domain-containing protein [Phaeovulum sp.]|uniref:PepSY domain-containing protein n=1 Tax=Phaeovulum sp. TaxID=2934796 RepID=UPI0039E56CBB
MKRNAILTLGSAALMSLGLLGGAVTMASADTSPAEAQAFLAAPGSLSAAVSAAETSTGGKAMSADFEEDGVDAGMYEVEIVMPDGTVTEHLVNPADNSVKAAPADDDKDEKESKSN